MSDAKLAELYMSLMQHHGEHHAEIAALRAKLDKAMEGLRIYANKNNWAPSVNMPQRHFISNQHGYTEAARILAELEQE